MPPTGNTDGVKLMGCIPWRHDNDVIKPPINCVSPPPPPIRTRIQRSPVICGNQLTNLEERNSGDGRFGLREAGWGGGGRERGEIICISISTRWVVGSHRLMMLDWFFSLIYSFPFCHSVFLSFCLSCDRLDIFNSHLRLRKWNAQWTLIIVG